MKILIIQTRPGIGDLCLFLPFMHKISENNANSEVTLLTKKRTCAKEILVSDPHIKNVKFINEGNKIINFFRLIKEIGSENFDKAYIMHYGLRYFLICKFNDR